MSRITDYSFLFQSMFGTKNSTGMVNSIQVSSLSSASVQSQLKAAGINTNSKQYKAAISQMTKSASAGMCTNVQAIKNLMSQYDSDGDYIDPTTGMAGLLVTEENSASRKRIIEIPESSREEIFEYRLQEFIQSNGMGDGDGRSEIYTSMQRKMDKSDRLAATYTMQQYERAYTQAFVAAAKAADSSWDYGKPIPSGALDGITRESVEATLTQSGSSLVTKKNSIDVSV